MPVSVPAVTPIGTLVFDHAWLSYSIGFGSLTYIKLNQDDRDSSLPALSISFWGNPVGDPSPLVRVK
jgi:hypothetical protein